MAYVNVVEWRAEQVAEWLSGLDECIYPYAHFFVNNNVTGQGLLSLSVDDLFKLHVQKLGHQEIILEALDMLKNLHYNLDTENLQYVCLKLSCRARSLSNEIRMYGPAEEEPKQTVTTLMMAAVADVLDSLWVLISWLDRSPFDDQQHYKAFKSALIEISILLATNAQRDRFAEKPVMVIRDNCEKLADLSDQVIRDVHDSLKLQPAYLDIAILKRKPDQDDFGIVFDSFSFGSRLSGLGPGGTPIVKEVRFGSMAHQTGRVEAGDEIIQVNYQTVVGWPMKKVMLLMNENPSELILTLKKRPRHSQFYGQIYMKPFRIPARQKKPANYFNNLPSPRTELLVAPSISFDRKPKRPNKLPPLHASFSSSSSSSAVQTPLSSSSGPTCSQIVPNPISLSASSSPSKENPSEPMISSSVGAAAADYVPLPSSRGFNADSDDSDDSDDVNSDDLGVLSSDDDMEYGDNAFLSNAGGGRIREGSKSPTQSIRSVLSRPRSAPQRRNTISGTSPSHYRAYINLSEIWNHMKAAKDKDDSSQPSSTTSTLHSKDSGMSTMSMSKDNSSVLSADLELRKKRPDEIPRPQTILAAFHKNSGGSLDEKVRPSSSKKSKNDQDKSAEHPFYMNLPKSSQAALTAAAKAAADEARSQKQQQQQQQQHLQQSSPSKNPTPMPRNQVSTPPSLPPKDLETPSKKRPIPQPRRNVSRNNSSLSHENNCLPSPRSTTSSTSGFESMGSESICSKDSLTRSLRNLLPDAMTKSAQPALPVPTANFKSFKRIVKAPTTTVTQSTTTTVSNSSEKPREQQSVNKVPHIPARPPPLNQKSGPKNPPPRPAKPTPQMNESSAGAGGGVKMRQKSPQKTATSRSSDVDGLSSHRQGMVVSSPISPKDPKMISQRLSQDSDKRSSSSSNLQHHQMTYNAGETYREGSPEKLWVDSLRKDDGDAGAAVNLPPIIPQRQPKGGALKSANCYHPLPTYLQEESKLKYAFDISIEDEQGEQHEYTRLSDISTSPLNSPVSSKEHDHQQEQQQHQRSKVHPPPLPELPPMFVPSTYRVQDMAHRKSPKKN